MSIDRSHIDFYLIGMSNHPNPIFSTEVLDRIHEGKVFSGGKRHYEIVKDSLPKEHQWIMISGKMESIVEQYQLIKSPIIIFVSGDPFFYGFGNTLQRLLPNAQLRAYPYFNSIQLLCHRTNTNYNVLKAVSVHGRDWSGLDKALISNSSLIGVLTDGQKTPALIAKRLLQYGFNNYTVTIGESLGSENEKVQQHSLEKCQELKHHPLNCILLHQTRPKILELGISDNKFKPLDERVNMITKMPIRLCTINALELHNASTMWDIGACTGSVSIEAKRCYPHLKITAFEIRKNCKAIIQENKERFSAPGIEIFIDDFFNINLDKLSKPDVVFIGGHGGRLREMIRKLYGLNPALKFVTNAVQESTSQTFINELSQLGFQIDTTTLRVDNYNEISIHRAAKN